NRLFTSKERDASGLYDYDARLYDPETGRFTQADDVASDGHSLNRFSYTLNNPLRLVDPSGHQTVDAYEYVTEGGGAVAKAKPKLDVPNFEEAEDPLWRQELSWFSLKFETGMAHLNKVLGRSEPQNAVGAYSSPEFPQLYDGTTSIVDHDAFLQMMAR